MVSVSALAVLIGTASAVQIRFNDFDGDGLPDDLEIPTPGARNAADVFLFFLQNVLNKWI